MCGEVRGRGHKSKGDTIHTHLIRAQWNPPKCGPPPNPKTTTHLHHPSVKVNELSGAIILEANVIQQDQQQGGGLLERVGVEEPHRV